MNLMTQADYLTAEQRGTLQAMRLKQALTHARENSPFYQELFQEAGTAPEQVRSPADLPLLPFTTKQDLRGAYPYGMAGAHGANRTHPCFLRHHR